MQSGLEVFETRMWGVKVFGVLNFKGDAHWFVFGRSIGCSGDSDLFG